MLMNRSRLRTTLVPLAGFLVVVLATGVDALSFTQPNDDARREFPAAPVIAGKPNERGHAYGKQFREAIRDFLDKEIYKAFVGRPSTKEQVLRYAAACGQVVTDMCPTVAEEFRETQKGRG